MASRSVERTQSVGQQLAEIERLMEVAERHANKLRDRLSGGVSQEVHEVAQLSDALDTILRLKISTDLLERFVAFGTTESTIEEVH